MKRIVTLFSLLVMLILSPATLAEEAFTPPVVPEFTPEYGLSELYSDLEKDWGAAKLWTLEQKAWLSSSMDTLLEMEYVRCSELGWAVTPPFTYPLSFYRHGLPDETAIDRATALAMAYDHLTSQGAPLSPDDTPYISFYYLVDFPEQPVWYHTISIAGTQYRTFMDAHTGQFSSTNADEVIRIASDYLSNANIQVARQPVTAELIPNYVVIPYYRPADGQWDIHFHSDYPATHQFIVTVDDTTLEVQDMTTSNG